MSLLLARFSPHFVKTGQVARRISPSILTHTKNIKMQKHTSAQEQVKYLTLIKNDNIEDRITELIEKPDAVEQEFSQMETFVKENFSRKTTKVAALEENESHNRYPNMVPFDNNFISLSSATGSPPTTYVNASPVRFERHEQSFIATQAPKPNTFSNFWQLVMENKVKLIVNTTSLGESDQYWPDESSNYMELLEGYSIKYLSQSHKAGSYFERTFEVEGPAGLLSKVTQLQVEEWPDNSAPEKIMVLLDLLEKTREIADSERGPILVHCSKGAGRTGTFIACYKLITDYMDKNVERLQPLSVVLAMREQRMKMVPRTAQYLHVLRDRKSVV